MKTISPILAIAATILACFSASGQMLQKQVLASGGTYTAQAGDARVVYTLGETITSDLVFNSNTLLQGFNGVPYQHFNAITGVATIWVRRQGQFFPNPVINTCNFMLPGNALGGQMDFYASDGRLVKSVVIKPSLENETLSLNLTDLSSGTYLMRYQSLNGSHSIAMKMIKQ